MKLFIAMMLTLFVTEAYAQDLTKDTIQLENVSINKKKVKLKSRIIASSCTDHEHLWDNKAIITLVDNLSVGYLYSITYIFNNPYDSKTADFKDAEVELLFFAVNDDNTPGERISYPGKTVFVSKDFSGKMEIDLRGLAVKSDGRLFIGLKNLTKNIVYKTEFEVDAVCVANEKSKRKYISYDRNDDKSPWKLTRYPFDGFKMKVKVEVL